MTAKLDRKLVKELSGKLSTEFASLQVLHAAGKGIAEVRLFFRSLKAGARVTEFRIEESSTCLCSNSGWRSAIPADALKAGYQQKQPA